MDILYWIFEYGKVFCGYLLLMFVWPSVVFAGHLRKRGKTYRFAFCVTVMAVIINTVVLSLGLFHHLDRRTILLVFYGSFILFSLINVIVCIYRQYRKKGGTDTGLSDAAPLIDQPGDGTDAPLLTDQPENGIKGFKVQSIATWVKRSIQYRIWPFVEKYSVLVIVLIWGMIYFSYGAFQIHSYGYGDLYVHHEWIYGLIEGNAFSSGVYPEGMHCFIYCMHMLFGIRVFSILLFLQGIHVAVFLIAAYCLLRKVFHWRHTPLFVLALFLTIDLCNGDLIHSMFRLQITMPLEFGLPMVCLCALYLTNYLNTDRVKANGKRPLLYLDSNLLLFSMALAAALTIHFHVLIMTFIICASFTLFALHKALNPRRLIPLTVSVVCACVIAAAPMAGALKQGIPFHDSIHWAVNAMDGEQSRELRGQKDGTAEEKEEKENEEEEKEEEEAQDIKLKGISAVTDIRDILTDVYENGYTPLYGAVRARWIAAVTLLCAVLCAVVWLFIRHGSRFQYMREVCSGYPPVILASFLYAVVYAAPMLGLPDIIPEGRFFAPGHMMLLAVMAIPFDILVSVLMCFCRRLVLWVLSCLSIAGIYGAAVVTGTLRGYLYYEMTRYNSVVEVTNSIIDTYPQHSYTLISPTDELFQIIQYGWHEELLSFVEKCASEEEYTLPSEYVFIYVEKKPILYAQSHFFDGPSWLAEEKYLEPYWEMYSLRYPDSGTSQSPEITATKVSEEEAEKDLPYEYTLWDMYLKLDGRTILESKAYDACQQLAERYPSAFKVYYEDDDFVCYYFKQDADEGLCNMGKEESDESD